MENKLSAKEIRQAFLDFFKNKGHQIVPSAPLVVKNDPTLLFVNSGMAPFKDYFLGIGKPSHPRIADTQKCLRVSGKHNDLEEVGVDTYHHTLFEMLGNWSFGDYFKTEAIAWSWELLTDVLKLEKDRLYVTIFEGNETENIPKDTEAYNEWKKVIAEDRILLGNKKDNFWEMGDTGPCGPCTEIHVDCRSDEERKAINGATLVNADHPQVIEIWNNVFIQFNRKKDGSLEVLPAKHVDTGMGFERLVRVLQGKLSNYDTDVFSGTITATENIVHKKYDRSDSKEAIAFRVLADHIRAVAFTISDGQLPSNTGAGYVIRRILRRAVRYYFSYLDRKEPLLHLLVPVLATQFEEVFPELKQQQDFVAKVILEEENSFLKTLENGLKRLDSIIKESNKTIEGKAAFELLDTYGFPIDLTKLIALENGLNVDENEFEIELQKQKDRSRAATELSVDDWITLHEGKSVFVGYNTLEVKAKILKYRKIKSKGKEQFQLVLNETPFYAESGGQVGDTGVFTLADNEIIIVDTKKENDLIVHYADELPTDLSGEVVVKVDKIKRQKTTIHHSATHLLQAALQQVLGKHIAQKGSLNNSEYLRFDFSHFSKMTNEEMEQVENVVNGKIRANIPVVIKEMSKEDATKLGAMALFGEKYGDVVRVVIMDEKYSVELCGGTHVGATGELGLFKITSESAVAAGVRRIEAVCGELALSYVDNQLLQFNFIKEALKNPKDILKSIQSLQDENFSLKKEIEKNQHEKVEIIKQQLRTKITNRNHINLLIEKVEGVNADGLKKIQFDLRNEFENLFFVATTIVNDKPLLSIILSDELVKDKKLHAGNMVKELAKAIKGGGGGQAFYATAGGNDSAGIDTVLKQAEELFLVQTN
ncbi:MAG TPA: alanine--tRNA ligase [Chitinophagales bacterium]|jgi:alanyl-tRNA synthetase|nr:alanine--tRNA ligase [Chitinophagales bacterium]HQV77307.1 alanine--tRNA ligase [Chitinophagales bacterium]HQW78368.1 alanine--tRNA ligase [Chitinophagales bacterium]HRB66776.1 alanine--tRNA ligase [Chitinophagales bacterium]HRB92237.1 alanine--tRNA ligase [Chitinophagales bacterium]